MRRESARRRGGNAVAGVLAGSTRLLDIDGAVAVIAARRVRRVDVAEVNERVFVNNPSLGLYADMVADRDRRAATLDEASGWRC